MKMKCTSPIDAWRFPGSRHIFFQLPRDVDALKLERLKIPCGRCISCRLERSRQWAVRCVHEAKQFKESSFITLTYSDDFLPENRSLVKRDLQLFFKRLRKEFGEKRIRYFACGEYGPQTLRPHYHAIIFGEGFKDRKKITRLTSQGISQFYVSELLTKVWPFGIASCGDFSFEAAAYCARYCLKKVYGAKESYEVYVRTGREPEFVLMSRRPGIGSKWFDKFGMSDVYPLDRVLSRGRLAKPPRYYDKLLEKRHPEMLADIKARRMANAPELEPFDYFRARKAAEIRAEKYNRECF